MPFSSFVLKVNIFWFGRVWGLSSPPGGQSQVRSFSMFLGVSGPFGKSMMTSPAQSLRDSEQRQNMDVKLNASRDTHHLHKTLSILEKLLVIGFELQSSWQLLHIQLCLNAIYFYAYGLIPLLCPMYHFYFISYGQKAVLR